MYQLKTWTYLLLAVRFFDTCHHKRTGEMQAIEVQNFSLWGEQVSYVAYKADSFTLYRWPFGSESFEMALSFDSTTNIIKDSLKSFSRKWVDQYFVFHNDSSYGYNYNIYEPVHDNKRVNVDSQLAFIMGTNAFDSLLNVKPDTILWNKDKTELKEVFMLPFSEEEPNGRMSLYYTKKLNHLKLSFNPKVDSVKKMKLYKTVIDYDSFYSKKHNRMWPAASYPTEMKETNWDRDEFDKYILKYKKSIARSD